MSNRIYLYPEPGEGEPHYLDRVGTIRDLAELGLTLTEGMTVPFWTDDGNDQGEVDNLLFEGTVHFDPAKKQWYAIIDQQSFRHQSDESVRASEQSTGGTQDR
jgi:hypothetical protein